MAVHKRHYGNYWVALAAGLVLGGCASPGAFTTEDVPDTLRAPANQLLTLRTHAKGVQIYQCKPAKEDATRFEWVLVAPEASLYDQTGKKVAKHYGGPTWESLDGSTVVGQVAAKASSPDGHSIPWLLLIAKSTTGNGQLSTVTSIQRLHTAGGAAPTSCDAKQENKQLRAPYTADYFFYVGPR